MKISDSLIGRINVTSEELERIWPGSTSGKINQFHYNPEVNASLHLQGIFNQIMIMRALAEIANKNGL